MAQKLEALAQAQSPDAPKPKIRVGLAWCGSLKSDSARRRAVPLRALLPLLDAGAPGDILFVSLQSREFAAQMAEVPEFPLLDMSSLTDDFADLAAVIANLDLVVSVDTSYAHLSAALGVPTWRMLPKRYDWRWGWGRQDSPWYPIDRQFWQTTEGNWAPVIDAIKNELGSLLAEPVDSHSPEWLQARILAATACIAPT
ncbi:MAG: glycosyltransferase family 9 protein [Casimicrobiaceae bacterium]